MKLTLICLGIAHVIFSLACQNCFKSTNKKVFFGEHKKNHDEILIKLHEVTQCEQNHVN